MTLAYDVAAAGNDGEHSATGFDGKGNTLPAEMLPSEITFKDVRFQLAKSHTRDAGRAQGQGPDDQAPPGNYNRVYLLAASADGDQKVTFGVGDKQADLNIQDWGGFIGQWDDRTWSSTNLAVNNAKYGEMTGLKQGFIKRADLAWYCDHHHDADGKNVTYAYSYLFGYALDLPADAKTLKLPQNDKVRILAISVANESPELKPAEPLYDVLPSPDAQPGVITYSNGATASTNTH